MDNLICPVCKLKLKKDQQCYRCAKSHCFDISSQGYTNLLLANQKNSLFPGDNKEMSRARKEFLNKGYFEPLSDMINEIIGRYVKNNSTILDAGCGTGYYVNNLQKQFNNNFYIGIDISKFALGYASKENKNIGYIVSSLYNMPIESKSVDAIINIFAPKTIEEFERVLKNDGYIIEVVPATNHLIEIKKLLYSENTYLNKESENLKNFVLVKTFKKVYSKIVYMEDVLSLIKMTPYFYKTKKEDLDNILSLSQISITFDFDIKLYVKNS